MQNGYTWYICTPLYVHMFTWKLIKRYFILLLQHNTIFLKVWNYDMNVLTLYSGLQAICYSSVSSCWFNNEDICQIHVALLVRCTELHWICTMKRRGFPGELYKFNQNILHYNVIFTASSPRPIQSISRNVHGCVCRSPRRNVLLERDRNF